MHRAQQVHPALPACDSPRTPEEVPAHGGQCIDALHEQHETPWRRVSERDEPKTRQCHRRGYPNSFSLYRSGFPYCTAVVDLEDVELRH